jgi:dihydroorotate dehydrogenase electron transfer subunit
MLRAVAEFCSDVGLPCQVAVEEMMACGLGVCWTCAVPLLSADGNSWWNVRACVEGPVFNGARVWWDRWLGEHPAEAEAGLAEEQEDEPAGAEANGDATLESRHDVAEASR